MTAGLAGLGQEFEDAARVHGADRMSARRLLAAMLAPAIWSALAINFAESISDFGVAATLAYASDFPLGTYQLYANTENYPANFPLAAGMAWLLVAAVALPLSLQARALRGRTYAVLSGRSRQIVRRPFFAVNIAYAYRNDERSTLNGLAAVIPACGMLLVSYRLGAGHLDPGAWSAAAACLLYFAGSVLYVKTMIRERRSRAYRVASGAYHGLSVIAAALLQPWLAAVFGFYLVRALVLPGRGLKVHVVGAVEIFNSAVLLAAVLLLL